jgi:hypothetical protein
MSTKNTTKRRCAQCGERAVTKLAKAGRTAPYRNMELPVPASVEIPTCGNCGTEWIDAQAARDLDEVLESAYHDRVRARLDEALDRILEVSGNQTRVERAIGVSPGYLSKLKLGKRNPSAEITSALWLISMDPESRLVEAEEMFTNPGRRKRVAG